MNLIQLFEERKKHMDCIRMRSYFAGTFRLFNVHDHFIVFYEPSLSFIESGFYSMQRLVANELEANLLINDWKEELTKEFNQLVREVL